MSTSVNWNNVNYSIPAAGETNWSALSNFLIALANNAQTTNKSIQGIRTATSSPVTVNATTDYTVVTNLSVAGAVAVTLPAGVNGQSFWIIDGKGDGGTNNITIAGSGGQTIAGQASYVINQNRGAVLLQWSTTENTWQVLGSASGASLNFPVRTATSSPVTVLNSDFCVMTNLSVAGAVTVNLPAGTDGKLFAIVDAKGDATTNNITITPNSGNINGAANYVINRNKGSVLFQYNSTESEWKLIAEFTNNILISPTISGGTLTGSTINNTSGGAIDVVDTSFQLRDAGDTTKIVRFDVNSAQTTGTTQIYTLPSNGMTIVGVSATQQITNKDIDGGTASNSLRITLPKNTTANLNALTRKEATLVYDTSTGQVKFDNGATLSALSTTSTATPTSQGVVTSYFPVVQSSYNSVSSADYTILTTDGYLTIGISTGSSNRTVTLPSAGSNTARVIKIIKTDSGTGNIIISGTVSGISNPRIYLQYGFCEIICDGTSYFFSDGPTEAAPWTPTLTVGTNLLTANNQGARFSRNGKIVTCTVRAELTASTAGGTLTTLDISLPIASNLTGSELTGVGYSNASQKDGGYIADESVNDRARYRYYCNNVSTLEHYLVFQYEIK